ncbi:hypothetical protein J7E51_27705 [Priestia megaterium]|nr:hypothetical protein [Priestia megaterium]
MNIQVIREDAKETAKKIRKELKEKYPNIKFSVRTSKYSGGSSISISWIDGPMKDEITQITDKFEGADFDGYNDLQTYKSYEYKGKYYNGADYVFAYRTLSDEYRIQIKKHALSMFEDLNINDHTYNIKFIEAEKDLRNKLKGESA